MATEDVLELYPYDQSENTITFTTSDGAAVAFDSSLIPQMKTINNLIEDVDVGPQEAIPLSSIDESTLRRVGEYLKYHEVHPLPPPPISFEIEQPEQRSDDMTVWDLRWTNLIADRAPTAEQVRALAALPGLQAAVLNATIREGEDVSNLVELAAQRNRLKYPGHVDLLELTMAANYLEIKDLSTLCAKAIANRMKGKTVEEFREYWGVKNDFTDAEYAAIQKQNTWCT
jgi:hypothetical protein